MLAVLFGALANAHTGITNVFQDQGNDEPVLLDRCLGPGVAGAFSDYADYNCSILYPVAAGEALFVSYGEHTGTSRNSLLIVAFCFGSFLHS
jgi:hypothetical protein